MEFFFRLATKKFWSPARTRRRGLGKGIFALLRFKLECFRFSLIKRKPKNRFFQILLKEKNGGRKKLKNVLKRFLFWFAVVERRREETHRQNYHIPFLAYAEVKSPQARCA